MIYLRRDTQIAACETERCACIREAQGWARVSRAVWMAAWEEQDRRTRLRLAHEDAQAAEWRELRRIVGKMPGKVYPVKVSEG
jgi:hypothetical protein